MNFNSFLPLHPIAALRRALKRLRRLESTADQIWQNHLTLPSLTQNMTCCKQLKLTNTIYNLINFKIFSGGFFCFFWSSWNSWSWKRKWCSSFPIPMLFIFICLAYHFLFLFLFCFFLFFSVHTFAFLLLFFFFYFSLFHWSSFSLVFIFIIYLFMFYFFLHLLLC